MQQMEQMLKQQELQNRITEIQAKGEEDRKTETLKYQYELQLRSVDADIAAANTTGVDPTKEASLRLNELSESNKTRLAQDKLNLERQKLQLDLYNQAANREVKREDMASKERIAKENKNKYDKK
jgi:hypothetical protein